MQVTGTEPSTTSTAVAVHVTTVGAVPGNGDGGRQRERHQSAAAHVDRERAGPGEPARIRRAALNVPWCARSRAGHRRARHRDRAVDAVGRRGGVRHHRTARAGGVDGDVRRQDQPRPRIDEDRDGEAAGGRNAVRVRGRAVDGRRTDREEARRLRTLQTIVASWLAVTS